MNIKLYARMALSNLVKNRRSYVPYIVTCIFSVATYYIMTSLYHNPATGSGTVSAFLEMGVHVLSVFSPVLLFYTNSFLIKRRKMEFGLYNILGMEKKHIIRMILLENLCLYGTCIGGGILLGVLFSKFIFLVLIRLLDFSIKYVFEISFVSMADTMKVIGVSFACAVLSSIWHINIAKPAELLRGSKTGEKEPKARWSMALCAVLLLAAGYYISITVENVVALIDWFFVAVILVMIGTFLLFTAGTIAFLKLMKANKNYYYKARHFISISGMMYRMKQNAAGLAAICILSTAVLVMISSTATLYIGLEDGIRARCPSEIGIVLHDYTDEIEDDMLNKINIALAKNKASAENIVMYRFRNYGASRNGTVFSNTLLHTADYDSYLFYVIPAEDFSRFTGRAVELLDGEALLYSNTMPYHNDTLTFGGVTFRITEHFDAFNGYNHARSYNKDLYPRYYLIVKDMAAFNSLDAHAAAGDSSLSAPVSMQIGFDVLSAVEPVSEAVYFDLLSAFSDMPYFQDNGRMESRSVLRFEFQQMYGGLFFLGIVLAVVFLIATVLIMYYKQISEGLDDKARFSIMTKVGLSAREATKAIHSQILTMFFLPLLMACVHISFSVPSITRLLNMLNMVNAGAFVKTTVVCAILFALFYTIIYWMTARVYGRIVRD